MNWELLSLSDKEKWEALITELPINQRDIYFYPEYYRLYKEYGDGEPFCFIFKNDKGLAIYPFLKNKIDNSIYNLNSEYFDIQGTYGYNGVISSSYDEDFKNDFSLAFGEFCEKENIVAEFTRFHPLIKNHQFSESHMTIIKDRQTVWLDLSADHTQFWKESYSSNNRNMIRKAQKNAIQVLLADRDSDYKLFYEIYLTTMKEVNALPYYYFDEKYALNFNSFIGNNQKLLIARYQGQNICAMLMMINGKYAHYHLSGRVKEFANLAANNLILDFAIQIAREHGAQLFHFGGGNSTDLKDPLFKFKSNFSKTNADFYIGKKVHNKEVYNQICSIWEHNNPEKKEKYANFLLKYRQ